ncbi:MAG: hypothetical protein IKC09_07305 [Oscillospiraceae bacterium]|nr:hypothetical protein [Oscillospiraceae bacterium]
MAKKQSKRQRDIKTKLMAAICMLLVSSIMMVSSTYAWFTLSTAPEVTGINTAVGANGNLEMALLPADGQLTTIDTNSAQVLPPEATIALRNTTWGNLVDVSDNTTYGLDKITLYPAALNGVYDNNGNPTSFAASTMLKTPTYGADGRVSTLTGNTVNSTFVDGAFPVNTSYGIRAVGTASGMSDRELAYRNARANAATSMTKAKDDASASLNSNGNALANIAIKKGTGGEGATYTQDDVEALLAIVNDLLGTEGEVGVLQHIENAYRQYILAYGASQDGVEGGMDDTEFKAFQGIVEDETKSVNDVIAELQKYGAVVPQEIKDKINALAASVKKVEDAKDLLEDLSGDSITWAQLSPALNLLANPDTMTVNDIPAKDITSDESINSLIQTIGNGITVSMGTGGGVYADVADHCGDYDAAIVIKEIKYGSLSVSNMKARMATKTTVKPSHLTAVGTVVADAGAPQPTEGAQVMPISDFFGYVIDMAFRTNAAESDLLLQQDAVDRIYEGSTGAQIEGSDVTTMGHGSTMTFKATTADFSDEQVKALMGAIRIVFFTFDGENNKVVATAKLDVGNAVLSSEGWTAKMYIYTLETETTTTYKTATAEQIADDTTTIYTKAADSETYTAVEDKSTVVEGTTYYIAETTTGAVREVKSTDNKIIALPQSEAIQLSCLVYLDGTVVNNGMVAATAATSMTGKMNLQFASSANLVPMNYTPLQGQTGTTEPETTTAPTTGG